MCHKILANIYSTNFLKDSKFRSKQKSQSLLSYCKLLVLHRLVLLLFLFYSTYINRLLPIYRCYVKLIRLNLKTSHHCHMYNSSVTHHISHTICRYVYDLHTKFYIPSPCISGVVIMKTKVK